MYQKGINWQQITPSGIYRQEKESQVREKDSEVVVLGTLVVF